MLSRVHRFHGRNSLNAVYRYGKTVRNQLGTLKYNPAKAGKPFRCAVVVSKKVHKSAVVRNRIRRRIFEIVRQQTQYTANDMIITVFSDQVTTMPGDNLRELLHDLFARSAAAPDIKA